MKLRWGPFVLSSAALLVGLATAKGRGRRLDHRLYRWLNRDRGPAADGFFEGITELGSIWASAGAAASLSVMGRRRAGADALGAAAAVWLVGQLVKRAFERPRPYEALEGHRLLIGRPRASSWPSSHPGVLLAFLTVATRDLNASVPVRAAATGLASMVGLSRVYLGVHYPADVVGGLLLGRATADLWSATVSKKARWARPSLELPSTVTP